MIIGAGIGGLMTGIALQSVGINIDIYEAAEELHPIGAGILIPPNAMRVLAHFGLAEKVRVSGNEIDNLQVSDYLGRKISTTRSSHELDNRYFKTVAIHRGKLHAILLERFGDVGIHLNCELEDIMTSEECLQVHFTNGHCLAADFVIGADGLRSKTRQAIIPEASLRDSQQTCWRGIANIQLAEERESQLTELWGNGTRFGFVPISGDQVYWYATVADKLYDPTQSQETAAYLQSVFSGYLSMVSQIIDSTPDGMIIEGHIFDLKPLKKWADKNVVLLGDAAHAITPNLGQGGALAIEDAFELAEKMARCGGSVSGDAFVEFQQARQHRVNKISRASWIIGQLTNWCSPMACTARNKVLRNIPQKVGQAQSGFLYNNEIKR